jgi:hypothetical protein
VTTPSSRFDAADNRSFHPVGYPQCARRPLLVVVDENTFHPVGYSFDDDVIGDDGATVFEQADVFGYRRPDERGAN